MKAVPDWEFVPERCEIGLGCGLEGRDILDCFNMGGQQSRVRILPLGAAFLRRCLELWRPQNKTWTC